MTKLFAAVTSRMSRGSSSRIKPVLNELGTVLNLIGGHQRASLFDLSRGGFFCNWSDIQSEPPQMQHTVSHTSPTCVLKQAGHEKFHLV